MFRKAAIALLVVVSFAGLTGTATAAGPSDPQSNVSLYYGPLSDEPGGTTHMGRMYTAYNGSDMYADCTLPCGRIAHVRLHGRRYLVLKPTRHETLVSGFASYQNASGYYQSQLWDGSPVPKHKYINDDGKWVYLTLSSLNANLYSTDYPARTKTTFGKGGCDPAIMDCGDM